jgi:large subunit ribosomal protein L34e
MVARITYRRKHSYNTRSNRIKAVRTPGGKFVAQYLEKKANAPKCADTGVQLYGIPSLRPFQYKQLAKRKRTVSRAYGGVLSAQAVRARIVRAFIAEEARVLKLIVKQRAREAKIAEKKAQKEKLAAKTAKKSSKKVAPKAKTAPKPAAKKAVVKK